MKVQGDIESVNLSTGEMHRRVVGNGESRLESTAPGFMRTAKRLLGILENLDEEGMPRVKLPNCPKCGEDELGVIHAGLLLCYRCGWKIEEKRIS